MKVITLDKEIFEKAFSLCNEKMTEEKIFEVLKSGNDVEKQIAILHLEQVGSNEQATLLVGNLTGQDGPIREACSVKIKELLLEKKNEFLQNEELYSVYTDAVCDVNPNICRSVIEFLHVLKNRQVIKQLLIRKLETVFSRIDNPDLEQKNFLTVRLFNVYWCLEAIGSIIYEEDVAGLDESFSNLLARAVSFEDYTINEKVAKIVTKFSLEGLERLGLVEVYKKLSECDNFYVKRYFENNVNRG